MATLPKDAPPSTGDNQEKENPSDEEKQEEETKEKHVQVGALPLDWTRVAPKNDKEQEDHPVRYPWDVVEIDPNDEQDLVIVGTAGQKITKMGTDLDQKVNCKIKQLILRSHLIQTMEGLGGFSQLELLELYDNMVDSLSALNEGPNGAPGCTLRVLDMSYNGIRDMAPVSCCPHLKELYLANNKLKTITGLKGLKQLVKIDLGANRIRVMPEEELSGLENLEELWLGKNKIEKIEGIEKLTKLRRLDVQSNRLTSVEGLSTQVNTLEELYLAHNGINDEGASKPTGLAQNFTELVVLDLSRNRLTSTRPFAHLTCLDELWLSGNKISSFDQVESLSNLTSLDAIYLEYNPLQDDFEYRKKLKELVPSLNQIDATMVGGLAAHGIASTAPHLPAETLEDQMRRMQDAAIEKAKREAEAKQQGSST